MDVSGVRAAARTWNRIAQSFSETRREPWPLVVDLLTALPTRGRLLDAGVGNGRHARAALGLGFEVVGLDVSRSLLAVSRRQEPRLGLVEGVLERPPFRDGSFDAVLCVATLHHIQGRVHRHEAWEHLHRCTRPGGTLVASAWALEQPGVPPPSAAEGAGGEPGDRWVAWKGGGHEEQRFVHFYQEGELGHEAAAGGWEVSRAWSPRLGGPNLGLNHFLVAHKPG